MLLTADEPTAALAVKLVLVLQTATQGEPVHRTVSAVTRAAAVFAMHAARPGHEVAMLESCGGFLLQIATGLRLQAEQVPAGTVLQ